MRLSSSVSTAKAIPCLVLAAMSRLVFAQSHASAANVVARAGFADAPVPRSAAGVSVQQGVAAARPQTPAKRTPLPQPRRILGLMPNYLAVSAGVIPPPPSPRQAFTIATRSSFDYSAFFLVGVTSLMAEGYGEHPQLGKGVSGYGRYYWRGFADKTDGNYWTDWALPSLLHEDERYFAKGRGPILNRAAYAATRILVARDYHGNNIFNTPEILGRGISQAIGLTYYPRKDQALGPFFEKYAFALGRDALTDTFREVWPDINARVMHRRH